MQFKIVEQIMFKMYFLRFKKPKTKKVKYISKFGIFVEHNKNFQIMERKKHSAFHVL